MPEELKIDYQAAIEHCYKTLRHAQGTGGCIAFAKGAEWMRDQVELNRRAQPEPAASADLDPLIFSCAEAAMTLRAMRGITDPSDFYDPFKELIRKAYWMGRDEAQAEYSTGLDNLRNALDSIKAADKELEDVRTTFAAPSVAPEPVAWTTLIEIDWVKRNAGRAGSFYAVKAGPNDIPLFAHPPRAPLTEEQIVSLARNTRMSLVADYGQGPTHIISQELQDFARAIEAAPSAKEPTP